MGWKGERLAQDRYGFLTSATECMEAPPTGEDLAVSSSRGRRRPVLYVLSEVPGVSHIDTSC